MCAKRLCGHIRGCLCSCLPRSAKHGICTLLGYQQSDNLMTGNSDLNMERHGHIAQEYQIGCIRV